MVASDCVFANAPVGINQLHMPLDTVLCLDTSGSMYGAGMDSLRRAVRQFLQGVQETASETGLRENVAVVEFGSRVRIVQSLTNQYWRVQGAVDSLQANGGTPMFEGLMEALKEILQNGGVISLAGGRIKMTPRVILMTDGKPTNTEKVIVAAASFSPKGYSQVGLPYPIPIACVGCGSEVDVGLLAVIAKITNGMFAIGDVSELSSFFRKQVLLIRFALQFAHDMEKLRNLILLREFMARMGEQVSEEELIGLKTLLLAMIVAASAEEESPSPPPAQLAITAPPPRSYSPPVRTQPVRVREEVNHCLHCVISLFFPLWVFVWCYLCCAD
ncbi:Hypp7770 [Branchiostoma lanceolatum]|uniref:Hypp7770 protein n=2 Tax=Branchiostoma lanceolatum TaxID=7740 RepID=A0A8J9Z344_BRALA|nr:Hypp7770 [Branchiostoma lanceolatum]